jgi:uncharacterized protein (DUF1330 family)
MAGYWVVRGSAIKDQKAFDEYSRCWGPIAEKYGARVIAGRGRHESSEGEHHARVLIIEFPSYEQAIACYEDPEYQRSVPYAHRAYDRDLVIVEGS